MANGFPLVASFLYFRTFRTLFFGWLQQGHRVDAGGLQQGCRQILGNLDETRFQIIFSIRPHEMYLIFFKHCHHCFSPPTFILPLVNEWMGD
jgi:hypothetical protein